MFPEERDLQRVSERYPTTRCHERASETMICGGLPNFYGIYGDKKGGGFVEKGVILMAQNRGAPFPFSQLNLRVWTKVFCLRRIG